MASDHLETGKFRWKILCKHSGTDPDERVEIEKEQEALRVFDLNFGKLRQVIEEKEKTISEKDKAIEEKEKTISEKDKSLTEKEKLIEELKRRLGEK